MSTAEMDQPFQCNPKGKPRGLALPRLFSNGMVLQRGESINIWGWAIPNEEVSIRFLGAAYKTNADADGKWRIVLSSKKPGGPYCMEIQAQQTIVLQDVWVGDVWICSGQSNMVLPMGRVSELYMEDIALSYNLGIRCFTVSDQCDFDAARNDFAGGQWEWANPESVLRFSATGYFFARSLFERYHIPIGIINASVGGSSVEAWMSEDSIQKFPDYLKKVTCFQNAEYRRQILSKNNEDMSRWYNQIEQADEGLHSTPQWSDEEYPDSDWQEVKLPSRWADTQIGPMHGVVWFRREFEIPPDLAKKPAKLNMGRIIDSDTVYINGLMVGTTGYQYPPRKYAIPGNVLHAGRNVICVRVVNTQGIGGFAEGKPYEVIIDGKKIVDLTGLWRFRASVSMPELEPPIQFNKQPLGLYNGMIAPAVGYTIKGFAWYQGESNTYQPELYQVLFEELIQDWRKKWNNHELPFLYVQLPNFSEEDPTLKGGWPEIREAQRLTLGIPDTAMAVTLGCGEWNDLHPLNKKAVGTRLAGLARELAYGEDIVCMGPLFKSVTQRATELVISFESGFGELTTDDGREPLGFEIADESGHFIPATAKFEGNTIIAWHDEISEPNAVRYAWADNPDHANLCGAMGLPASPFRAFCK